MGDVTHRTAIRIKQLSVIITEGHFKELTGGIRVEDLSQEVAAPIEAHLSGLYEKYADYTNLIIEFVEEHNEKRRLNNPKEWSDGLVPRLITRESRVIWSKSQGA